MPTVTPREIITGLYAGTFNRAPDEQGLNYWVNQASVAISAGTSVNNVYQTIMDDGNNAGFVAHPTFVTTYGSLNSASFVAQIYQNILGQAGDPNGLTYWEGQLNNSMSRGDMVATFVKDALEFDQTDPKWSSLSPAQLAVAVQRQELLQNKVETSLYFIDTLGNTTNPNTLPLENDPAYLASIAVLNGVTDDSATLNTAKQLVDSANAAADPIDFILNPPSGNVFTANKINFDTTTAADSTEATTTGTDNDIVNTTAAQASGASTVIDGLAGLSDILNITDTTGTNTANLSNNAANIENIEQINLAAGVSQLNLLTADIAGNAGGEVNTLIGVSGISQTLMTEGDVNLIALTTTNIEEISAVDTAASGINVTIDQANLSGLTRLALDDASAGGSDTLILQATTGASTFDFSSIDLDFDTASTLLVNSTASTIDVTVDSSDLVNVALITGESGAATTALHLTGANADGDLSAMTITNIDTVTIGGTTRTLTLDDSDLSSNQYTTITGAGDSLLVFNDTGTQNIDLSNATVSGFTSISVDISNNDDTLVLDATSLSGAVTLIGGASSNIQFTESYDASEISVTTGDFDSLTLDAGVALIVDGDIFSTTPFPSIDGNGTGTLTVNMSSTTLDLSTYALGNTSDIETVINDTSSNDSITASDTKSAGSTMVVNLNKGGNDVVKLKDGSGNVADAMVISDAVTITGFDPSNDQINIETALITTNSVVSKTSGNVDQDSDGIIVLTGTTMSDFTSLNALSAAVGNYSNGATNENMLFAISNVSSTETALYSFIEDGSNVSTVDAADTVTLIGIVEHTGSFDTTDISVF